MLLGAKNAGKRTLIDSLHATSATTYPKVSKQDDQLPLYYHHLTTLSPEHNETHPGLLRVAGSASALDYVYLNVKNLDEPEEGKLNSFTLSMSHSILLKQDTLARLGVYIMDDDSQK